MVCNDIPRDIPERDPPRTYFVRIDPHSEPHANALGNELCNGSAHACVNSGYQVLLSDSLSILG